MGAGWPDHSGREKHSLIPGLKSGSLVASSRFGGHGRSSVLVKVACSEATGVSVEVAFADQGYTGEQTALEATQAGVELIVVKRPEATKGFILLPKRWVVERSFAWLARFRRLGRDLERLPSTLIGFHFLAACILLCNNLKPLFA